MEYKHIFIGLLLLNLLTIAVAVIICYKRNVDILSQKVQIKIYFWSTLPYLTLMACLADIAIGWKIAMVIVGLGCATLMFSLSNKIETLRRNKH